MKGEKDDYKKKIKLVKTFRFYYNGESRKIFINRLAVIPEGVSSFYTLSDSKRKNNDGLYNKGLRFFKSSKEFIYG